jgi:hypothetical protein
LAGGDPAIHHAMNTYVAHLVSHRALVRLTFVGVFDVGPAIVGRLTRSVDLLTKLLTDIGPAPNRGPLVAREAITGTIWAIIFSHATNDRVPQLSALVDQLTFITLTPHVGAKAAVDATFARQPHADPTALRVERSKRLIDTPLLPTSRDHRRRPTPHQPLATTSTSA